jgi:serine/threonine-protein phosphatase 2A regulatory subunit B'
MQDKLPTGLDATNGTVPRNPALGRLRPGPKDIIPMAGKPPRKQRSSRFVVTDKVEIERLPPFNGSFYSTIVLASFSPINRFLFF